jgi:hypothetical protein
MQIRLMWTLGLTVAVMTAACGDSKSSLIPTAPSAASVDAASVDAGTADGEYGTTANGPKPGNGNGNGNGHGNNGGGNGNGHGNGNGNQPRTPTNTSPGPTPVVPPGKSKVEFEGLIQAVSSGSILVNGQALMVTADTVIRHGSRTFALSDLKVGDRVHVRANRVTAPASGVGLAADATLQAAEIKLQNPGDGDDSGGAADGLVSVTATDPMASETGANTGTFTLTRTGTPTQLALPLTVSYTLTGTALNGTDYTAPLSATFLADQPTVTVVITPAVDAVTEGAETVILTLTTVAPYELGSPTNATVTITDTANPLVSVTAPDATANETGDPGTFVFTRTGDLSAPLDVTVAITGTATNGSDYQPLSATVSFAAGQGTMNVDVQPILDVAFDSPETVIVTIVDGAVYDLGTPSSATVTILGL